MKRKKTFLTIAILAIVALALAGCTGKKDTSGSSGNSTTQSASRGAGNTPSGNNDSLFDIPKNEIRISDNLDKDVVLAEIPTAMFKGVGTVYSVDVWANNIGSFKYITVLKFNVKSNENAVKNLMDYYRSVGANVEETGNRYNPYSVVFEWGESTEIDFGSSEGQDYVNLQFSVVK